MARPKNNNNPFAIIQLPPDKWKGLEGHAPDGFLKFKTPYDGARAGYINLMNGYFKHGLNTIEKIFPVYAPLGHGNNVPEDYIKRVVQLTGISRNKILSSKDEIYKLGKAIVTHEEGSFWMKETDLRSAFDSAMNTSSAGNVLKNISPIITVILILILFFL